MNKNTSDNSNINNSTITNDEVNISEEERNEDFKIIVGDDNNEEDDDDEGFSIISDDDDNNSDNNNDDDDDSKGNAKETTNTNNNENNLNMEVEASDINKIIENENGDDDEDDGFSIMSDDDDDDDENNVIDTENIDGSNELDFIRGIARSDPKKMTKAIIENAQKLMNEERDKVAQEVTNAMNAEAESHKKGSKDTKYNDDNNNNNNKDINNSNTNTKNNIITKANNAKYLQLKARELNNIDQNIKALQELKAGEVTPSPSPTARSDDDMNDVLNAAAAVANEGAQMQAGEDERAYLIRIGKITPFADKAEMEKQASELGSNSIEPPDSKSNAVDDEGDEGDDEDAMCSTGEEFFGDGAWKDDGNVKMYRVRVNKWKRNVLKKLKVKEQIDENVNTNEEEGEEDANYEEEDDDDDDDDFSSSKFDDILIEDSDDETATSATSLNDDNKNEVVGEEDFIEDDQNEDDAKDSKKDGNEKEEDDDGDDSDIDDSEIDEQELFKLFQGSEAKDFSSGFSVPMWVYKRLYGYQRVGVQWLWELHMHDVGGILGDEMGLGKTVTIVSFVASLFSSGKINAPVLVVCPATLMAQWAHEFHAWCAPVRVVVLHASGTAGPKAYSLVRTQRAFKALGATVFLTTYEGVRIHQQMLTRLPWAYVILDEGHKIKNPDSMVTLACKNFRTSHRLIMSGTPIQNSLRELWSLFDFVNPHLLGTLPIFYTHFIKPISDGSFANASGTQAQVAFKSSSALHRLIDPYLLRRVKRDVLPQLPRKREEVLLCALTKEQARFYKNFLSGHWMSLISEGKLNMLFGVDVLRKICNHPDLVLHPQKVTSGREWIASVYRKIAAEAAVTSSAAVSSATADMLFRSGKLRVVRQLLRLWDRTGHKALLFCQTRQMLNIVEVSVASLAIPYLRMDGMTTMKARPALISKFNTDPAVKIFLLTTKVGGLGVNLTAADRVIIYDPDWNPAVDEQARERVLRIGQEKEVCIYRLLTAGTIEEKVYHRQLFKQSLQNSVLNDVRQKRLFRAEFLKQLFSFNPDVDKKNNLPDTAKIFRHLPQKQKESDDDDDDDDDTVKIQNESDISKIRDNYVPPSTTDGSQQQQQQEEETKDGKKKKKEKSETSILKNILSIIDQESITDQDMKTKADDLRSNAAASSIVHETLRSFTSMRRKIKDADKFTPTWTGSHGKTGMPENARKKAEGSKTKTFGAVKSNAAAPSSSAVLDNISKTFSTMRKSPSPSPVENKKVTAAAKAATKVHRKKVEAPKMNPGEFDLFNPPPPPPPPPPSKLKHKDKRVHESNILKPLIVQRKQSPQRVSQFMAAKTHSSSSSSSSSSSQKTQKRSELKPPPPKVAKITDFFGTAKAEPRDDPIPAENYPTDPVAFTEKVFIDLTKYFMDNDGSLPTVKIIKKFKYVVGEDPFKIKLFKKTLESIAVLNIGSKIWCLKEF